MGLSDVGRCRPGIVSAKPWRCAAVDQIYYRAIWILSQFFPATTSTESLTAWPERLVPAARNVIGTFNYDAAFNIDETSSSEADLMTIRGVIL